MIEQLVLHPSTRRDIKQFLEAPSHCLLLVGPEGSGKPSLARAVLAQILSVSSQTLVNHPYFLHLQPIKGSLIIDQVRQAQDFVKLKTTGSGNLRRAILVEDAHKLTPEAQNAFLKLLEEPPADTIIILTASATQSLLPTIRSRTQKITVRTPHKADLEKNFNAPSDKLLAAFYMSSGQVGLMSRILANDGSDDLLGYIEEAKQMLKMSSFERLAFVDQFVRAKKSTRRLLWALAAIANAALHQAAQRADRKTIKHWQELLGQLNELQQQLQANPNQKLLLTNLVLSF